MSNNNEIEIMKEVNIIIELVNELINPEIFKGL